MNRLHPMQGRGDGAQRAVANDFGFASWRALPAVRENRILVMDTTLVGRPGVRIGEAARSLARLMHPGVIP